MASQPKRFPGNLFVQFTLELEHNSAHGNLRRPVVEFSLSLTHTLFVTLGVDTQIGTDTLVERVVHTSQTPLDRFLCDFERLGGQSTIVVLHPQAIVAPDDSCTPIRSTSGDMRATLGRFRLLHELRSQPVKGRRGRREAS